MKHSCSTEGLIVWSRQLPFSNKERQEEARRCKISGHLDNPSKDGKPELERMRAQKVSEGEFSSKIFYQNPWDVDRTESFVEYTASRDVAKRFGSSSLTLRGGFIEVEIKAQYVNDFNPKPTDPEQGFFCANAAPLIRCKYMYPETRSKMIEEFNTMRENLPSYEKLKEQLEQVIGTNYIEE